MKKIYRPLIKGTNWALAGLLALVGFSCSDDDEELLNEYGTPHANYRIKGAVKDAAGAAIPGISIRIQDAYMQPAYSSEDGTFQAAFGSFPNNTFTLIAEDTDGAANGSFQTDSVKITFSKEDFYEEGDGWYEGAAQKEIGTIILKETEKEEGTE